MEKEDVVQSQQSDNYSFAEISEKQGELDLPDGIDKKAFQSKKINSATVPGLVYVSFLPPKMTPLHLKQIFSKYGELGRIYLQPDSKLSYLSLLLIYLDLFSI